MRRKRLEWRPTLFSDFGLRVASRAMYLRFARRRKDGKEHRYWSIVESRRCAGGRVVQRPVLYLGEINDSQHAAWSRVIEAFDEGSGRYRQLALFPAERTVPDYAKGFGVQVRLDAMELHRPRQWGACWLACHLYEQLQLDRFFAPLLPNSREGTSWQHILQTLVCYRLIDPGSEWRLHRQWFEQSAMADLLGEDYSLVEKNALYRCLDKLLPHKAGLFSHLRARWQDWSAAKCDVLLYALPSTYFESPPPDNEADKRRHGYSRDKRNDCVQVVLWYGRTNRLVEISPGTALWYRGGVPPVPIRWLLVRDPTGELEPQAFLRTDP